MPVDERAQVALDDEVRAVALERLDRRRARRGRRASCSSSRDALAGDVGVLLGARERELLLDDLLGEHEPRVVVAGAS